MQIYLQFFDLQYFLQRKCNFVDKLPILLITLVVFLVFEGFQALIFLKNNFVVAYAFIAF